MLTKKDFTKVAEILSTVEDETVRKNLAYQFSMWFKVENPKFNLKTFEKAVEKGV